MKTERTVIVSLAFGWIMSYRFATVLSWSAIIGKFTRLAGHVLDVALPLLVRRQGIDAEADHLRVALVELRLERRDGPELGRADRREVLGMREEHRPRLALPLVELDGPSVVSAVKSGASSPSPTDITTSKPYVCVLKRVLIAVPAGAAQIGSRRERRERRFTNGGTERTETKRRRPDGSRRAQRGGGGAAGWQHANTERRMVLASAILRAHTVPTCGRHPSRRPPCSSAVFSVSSPFSPLLRL